MSHVRLNSVSFYVNYIIMITLLSTACSYAIVSSSLGPRPHTNPAWCRYLVLVPDPIPNHFSLIPRPHANPGTDII